jgi:hypothetical protein
MAEFLITTPEPMSWSLSVRDFADAVIARWPGAGVRGWGDGAHLAASAWIRADNPWDDILIELHPNGSSVGVDVRSYELVADIACWWRGIVPAEIPVLWLFDRSFSGYSSLRPGAKADEVFPGAGRS